MHDGWPGRARGGGPGGRVAALLARVARWLTATLLLGSVPLVVVVLIDQAAAAAAPAGAEGTPVGAGPDSWSVDGAAAGNTRAAGLDGPGATGAAPDDQVRVAEHAAQDVLVDIDSFRPPPAGREGRSAATQVPSSHAPDPGPPQLLTPPQAYWRPGLDAQLATSERKQPTPPPEGPEPPAATEPTPPPGGPENAPTTIVDAGVPAIQRVRILPDPAASGPGGQPLRTRFSGPGLLQESAAVLLSDPRVQLTRKAHGDLAAEVADPRLVAVLAELADRWAPIRVTFVKTGHRKFVAGTDKVSHHVYGRAADLDRLAGQPVTIANPAAREAVAWLATLTAPLRPDEVGSPFAEFDRLPGWFSGKGHHNHIHLAWNRDSKTMQRTKDSGQ
jgi:hypothetical protein